MLLPDSASKAVPPVIDRVDLVDSRVVITAHPRGAGSAVPTMRSGVDAGASRYQRHLADLPVSGQPVELWLTVRRFFCDHGDRNTCTFVEQVPELTKRHARRSPGPKVALVVVVGAGGATRLTAGYQSGDGGKPVDSAAVDPRHAGSAGRPGDGPGR